VVDPSTHLFYGGTDGQAEPVFTKGGGIGIAPLHFSVTETGLRFQKAFPDPAIMRIIERCDIPPGATGVKCR
jgi:hypothetical protein